MIQQIETFEPPREYNASNVQFWEPISKGLKENKQGKVLIGKAKKFLDQGCVEQKSPTSWICSPLKGYNKTNYYINSIQDGFECNCQGFKQKLKEYEEGHTDQKPICSHVLAVIQYNFMEANN